MATTYPGAIDSPTNPTSGNTLNSPSHSGQHQFENDAIVAIETAIGVTGSAVTGTVNYILSGVAGGDKVLSRTGTETATNKTLGTGTVISLGSDTTGDMYYRNSSGVLARMAGGTTGQIVQYNASGIPVAVPNPAAALSSTTVNGTVQIATTADITAGNGAGSTGAILVVPASAVGTVGASKIVQFTAATKYPAADGSLITNLPGPSSKNGVSTSPTSASTQTIAHGLGYAPKTVKITATLAETSTQVYVVNSSGTYNGTTTACVYSSGNISTGTVNTSGSTTTYVIYLQTNSTLQQQATITVDATNISLVWTSGGTYDTTGRPFMWEAI